jgi:hypothetical protein
MNHSNNNIPDHIYIVGAGGITTYFLPAFIKTMAATTKHLPAIHIIDGDAVEERNLERQLFDQTAIAKNKAIALVERYRDEYPRLYARERFFHPGEIVKNGSLLFVFVDNHAARRSALMACDRCECTAILAANEYTAAQALWYHPSFRGGRFDPRLCYPEIETDQSNNPIRPRGCTTHEALEVAPQLPIANVACAAYALQLFWFYFRVAPSLEEDSRSCWPIEHTNNFNLIQTRKEQDYVRKSVET